MHNSWENLSPPSFYCSSCCQQIIIAAYLKGIPLEFTYIDLGAREHTTEEYKQYNPSASVPILVVTSENGEKTTIRQSMTILEYFEERFPDIAPLFPPALRDRVIVRDLVNIIAIDTQPPTNSRIAQRVKSIRGKLEDQVGFVKQAFTDGFRAYESLLTKQAEEGTFSFGGSLSMADVVLVPAVDQALMYRLDLDIVPNVKRIYLALKELEPFKAADWRNQGGHTGEISHSRLLVIYLTIYVF
ncbi:Maleylacetoacetate isomerase [Penicillium atrosanguineum]|nr:Maleylacetoacetate isomerase [Penicillium atrosanguineum]